MGRYLERSVEAFTQQQQSVQAQLSQLMQQTPMAAMAELARQNLEAWQQVQAAMFGGLQPPPAAAPTAEPPAAATASSTTGKRARK